MATKVAGKIAVPITRTVLKGTTVVSSAAEAGLAVMEKAVMQVDPSEVKALLDILGRTEKQVRVRFDVASSAALGEVLAVKPVALHLVCHADYDPFKMQSGQSESASFFLGLEDAVSTIVEGSIRLDELGVDGLSAVLRATSASVLLLCGVLASPRNRQRVQRKLHDLSSRHHDEPSGPPE